MGSDATGHWSQTRSCATLQARHLDEGSTGVLELAGEADLTTIDLLTNELERMLALHRENVVVDISDLSFCDSASAHLLLAARRDGSATLTGARGSVKRVFDLVDALEVPS
jgi:anti-sigma B factor antagonist